MNQVWSNTNNNRNILEILFKNILKSKNQIDIYETKNKLKPNIRRLL